MGDVLYFPFRPRLIGRDTTPAQDMERALSMAEAARGTGKFEAASNAMRRAFPEIAGAYDPYRRERDAKLLAGALDRIADRPSDTEPPGAA